MESCCSVCGKAAPLRCPCHEAAYCSASCQGTHWPSHKKLHRERVRTPAAAAKAADKLFGALDLKKIAATAAASTDLVPHERTCPICMDLLPLDAGRRFWQNCCGAVQCITCHDKTSASQPAGDEHCAFCRVPEARTITDAQRMLHRRVVLGDLKAIANLGQHYLHGTYAGINAVNSDANAPQPPRDFPRDPRRAFALVRISAERGDVDAIYNLALALVHGRPKYGCDVDMLRAFQLYMKGAELGEFMCAHNIGCFYGNGTAPGGEQSWAKAAYWFRRATAQGNPASLDHLRMMHENGYGGITAADVASATSEYETALLDMDTAGRAARRKHCFVPSRATGRPDLGHQKSEN